MSEASQHAPVAVAAAAAGLRFAGAMLSDVGRVREVNEDSVAFVVPPDREAGEPRLGMRREVLHLFG